MPPKGLDRRELLRLLAISVNRERESAECRRHRGFAAWSSIRPYVAVADLRNGARMCMVPLADPIGDCIATNCSPPCQLWADSALRRGLHTYAHDSRYGSLALVRLRVRNE
jgi:hypothetical protein